MRAGGEKEGGRGGRLYIGRSFHLFCGLCGLNSMKRTRDAESFIWSCFGYEDGSQTATTAFGTPRTTQLMSLKLSVQASKRTTAWCEIADAIAAVPDNTATLAYESDSR